MDTAQIGYAVRQTINYREEPEIKSPYKIIADRSGDCKHYSILTKAALNQNGRDCTIWAYEMWKEFAHAVCVEDGVGVWDNGYFFRTKESGEKAAREHEVEDIVLIYKAEF